MRYITLIILLIISFGTLHSQEFRFDEISIEDGLSQISINALTQDDKGFLWIGTQDGLNRFDGRTFKVYKNVPFDKTSLSENYINALNVDKKGVLWVGTFSRGLHYFNSQTQKFVRFQHNSTDSFSLSNDIIEEIYTDSEGHIWVATPNGFNWLDITYKNNLPHTVKFRRFLYIKDVERGDFSNKNVKAIFRDKKGYLWVGTVKGLIKYKITKNDELHHINTYLPETFITAIGEDRLGNIWLGTNKGAKRFNPKNASFVAFEHDDEDENSLSNQRVREIITDRVGNLYIGTNWGLNILKYKKGEYSESFHRVQETPNATNAIHNNIASVLLEDKYHEGLIWVGTPLAGLSKMYHRNKKFESDHLQSAQIPDYVNPVVRNIRRSKDGELWLGTDRALLIKTGDSYEVMEKMNVVGEKEPVYTGWISKFYEDKHSKLWGTSRTGLYEFTNTTTKNLTAKRHIPSEEKPDIAALCLYEVDNGLYVGSWSGVNFFDFETNKFRFAKPFPVDSVNSKIIGYHIKDFLKDGSNNFWIATSAGLILYRDVKTNIFDTKVQPEFYYHDEEDKNSISSQDINDIYEDKYGEIWLGTTNGLIHVKVEEQGLQFEAFDERNGLANNMIYGILESEKALWMSTNKGLAMLNFQTKKIDNFDIKDGLQSNEFNARAFYKAPDGELLFGGINGYTTFYPNDIKVDNQPPQVWITKLFRANKEEIDLIANNQKMVRLPYRQNTFHVQFVGLDYLHPDDVTFFYDLEGSKQTNIPLGKNNQVNFTKLPSGTYNLRIKAANKDGIINETGDTLQIIIATPFWRMGWFYLLIAGFVALLIWSAFYIRYQYKLAQLAEIEKVRKSAAEDFHDELGSKLTIISMFGELTRSKLNGHTEEVGPYISKVIDTSNSLYQSMKDLLWALNPEQDTVKDLYFQMKDFGDELYDQTGVEFQSEGIDEVLSDELLPMEYKRHVLLIFKELMNNALKHSECTEVSLKVLGDENTLKIEFQDNGVGFDIEQQSEGDGLKNIFSRANKINGKLDVTSSSAGSKFTLTCSLKTNTVGIMN